MKRLSDQYYFVPQPERARMLGRLMGWRAKCFVKPNHSALRIQIAAMLNAFFSIRGRSILCNDQTAVVMRQAYETFVTTDRCEIENPESVIAVVCLKDIESYQEFKRVHSDNLPGVSVFAGPTLHNLADQVTEELLRQVKKPH
jgi:hypothetical protein